MREVQCCQKSDPFVERILWGKAASAIVLSVYTELFAEAGGEQKAVVFFEIGGEVGDAEEVAEGVAYLVDEFGVFVRADGERGGEKIEIVKMVVKIFRGGLEAQIETAGASLAALGQIFIAARPLQKLLRGLRRDDKFYAAEIVQHGLERVQPPFPLLGGQDVGVVIKRGDVKIRRDV